MNKHQAIWLIIRLFGVYLAFLTLTSLFGLVGSIPALFTLPKIEKNSNKNTNTSMPQNPTLRVQPISPNANYEVDDTTDKNGKNEEDSISAKFRGENVTIFLWFLILTAAYGAAAWYLLRDGRILFRLLDRETPTGLIREKEAEVTTLNLSDGQS